MLRVNRRTKQTSLTTWRYPTTENQWLSIGRIKISYKIQQQLLSAVEKRKPWEQDTGVRSVGIPESTMQSSAQETEEDLIRK